MKQLLYISFFLFSILSFGQEIVVSGIVIDKKTDEPIYYASVLVDKKGIETRTDFDGKYSLNVLLNDTLIFSFIGMKTLKVKVCKEEINIELEEVEELKEDIGPPYYPKTKRLEATTIVTKEEIENANNSKYNFKKNAKNNVFVIFVSELTSYDLSKKDLEFQQKYNIKYSLVGNYKMDYLRKYNKLTFKHLKKKYKKSWLTEIRKDTVGLEDFLK